MSCCSVSVDEARHARLATLVDSINETARMARATPKVYCQDWFVMCLCSVDLLSDPLAVMRVHSRRDYNDVTSPDLFPDFLLKLRAVSCGMNRIVSRY